MKVSRNLSHYINVFFVLTLVTVIVTSYFTFNEVLNAHNKKQQQAIAPLYSLLTNELIRPVLVAHYMASDEFVIHQANHEDLDDDLLIRYLNRIGKQFNVHSFVALDKHQVLVNSDGGRIQLNNEKAEWYHRLKLLPDDIYTDIGDYKSPKLFIDIKLKDASNEFLGFVGVGIDLSHYAQVFANYKQRFGYNFVLANMENEVMLSSDELMETGQHHRQEKVINLSSLSWYQKFVQDAANSKKDFTSSVSVNEQMVTQLPIEELNWQLFIIAPDAKNQQEYWKLFTEKLILFLIVLVVLTTAFAMLVGTVNNKLMESAEKDQLTELPNRHFVARIYPELTDKYDTAAVLIADIDDFKLINDQFGHNAGDNVLKHVASAMLACTRQVDSVVRWGGEEFMIILPDTEINEAMEIAQRVQNLLKTQPPPIQHQNSKITLSFGLTETRLKDKNLQSVIHQADIALYQAKQNGKDQVVVYQQNSD